jgi:hypothetical protein
LASNSRPEAEDMVKKSQNIRVFNNLLNYRLAYEYLTRSTVIAQFFVFLKILKNITNNPK